MHEWYALGMRLPVAASPLFGSPIWSDKASSLSELLVRCYKPISRYSPTVDSDIVLQMTAETPGSTLRLYVTWYSGTQSCIVGFSGRERVRLKHRVLLVSLIDASALKAEHAVRSNECKQAQILILRIEVNLARGPMIFSQVECASKPNQSAGCTLGDLHTGRLVGYIKTSPGVVLLASIPHRSIFIINCSLCKDPTSQHGSPHYFGLFSRRFVDPNDMRSCVWVRCRYQNSQCARHNRQGYSYGTWTEARGTQKAR